MVKLDETEVEEKEAKSEEIQVTPQPSLKPSIEEPPELELKLLPNCLKYDVLGENSTLPIIISSKLSKEHKRVLLRNLEKHKKAIAWKIIDIQGISPSFCIHKILLKEGSKPVIQPQRRLNSNK